MGTILERSERDREPFVPRPTDVIISPFPKCGTTWLQQMVHSLRTGGDMDFDDIYEVVPWIGIAPLLDQDLDADQRAAPRAFKSHATWHDVPPGCRYIVSFRDPKDAAVSFFHFLEGWLLEPGAVDVETFVASQMFDVDSDDTYWAHAVSWLAQRDNPDVLLLTFDEMKQDLPGVVRRVAAFLDLPLDDRRLAVATEQSSFEFMSAHAAPFSEPLFRAWTVEQLGLPADSQAAKVRDGDVGRNRRELHPDTARRLDELWVETIGEATGLQRYTDLVTALRPGQH